MTQLGRLSLLLREASSAARAVGRGSAAQMPAVIGGVLRVGLDTT